MSTEKKAAIVLAAGKGTRMKSDQAKVLFTIGGRTLIDLVLDSAEAAGIEKTVVVVGHQHERVRDALVSRGVEFALQEPQLGTGHAVQCAARYLEGFEGDVAVLAGDAPLIRPQTLSELFVHHRTHAAAVTILTALLDDPTGYGRIVRDASGAVTSIVEHRDATEEQHLIKEINSSIYAFQHAFLLEALPRLGQENEQGEYYLTDTVHMAFGEGLHVEGLIVPDPHEVSGINTPQQLEAAGRVLAERS